MYTGMFYMTLYELSNLRDLLLCQGCGGFFADGYGPGCVGRKLGGEGNDAIVQDIREEVAESEMVIDCQKDRMIAVFGQPSSQREETAQSSRQQKIK